MRRQVWSWGSGEYGRCGNGTSDQAEPEVVDFLEDLNLNIVQISAGDNHNAVVTSEGDLYVWGRNDFSQLGIILSATNDLTTAEAYPVLVDSLRTCGDAPLGALCCGLTVCAHHYRAAAAGRCLR